MIDNPLEWFKSLLPYVIKPSSPSYGDLCVLSQDVPDYVKSTYNNYLELLHKCIQSWDCLIFKNLCIVGVDKEKLAEYTPKGKEQVDILFELIDKGIIDNNPYIKI